MGPVTSESKPRNPDAFSIGSAHFQLKASPA
jgi:hypothetical protein